jgi:hypothetical protein
METLTTHRTAFPQFAGFTNRVHDLPEDLIVVNLLNVPARIAVDAGLLFELLRFPRRRSSCNSALKPSPDSNCSLSIKMVLGRGFHSAAQLRC